MWNFHTGGLSLFCIKSACVSHHRPHRLISYLTLTRKFVFNIRERIRWEEVQQPQRFIPSVDGHVFHIPRNEHGIPCCHPSGFAIQYHFPATRQEVVHLMLFVCVASRRARCSNRNFCNSNRQATCWRAVSTKQSPPINMTRYFIAPRFSLAITCATKHRLIPGHRLN